MIHGFIIMFAKYYNNCKERNRRWIFDLNYSRIYPNKKYKVIYVTSIPGMYSINHGKLDIASINNEQLLNNLESGSNTSIRITNPIRNFHYTISFGSDIHVI